MTRSDATAVKEIADRVDMAAFASAYTRLTPRGRILAGRCPVHNGPEHSFEVDTESRLFSCAVCGRVWGLVDMTMQLEGLTYARAVARLGETSGTPLPDVGNTGEAPTSREMMFAANVHACRFFADSLHSTDEGRDIGMAYFAERGVAPETARTFGLGYAPRSRTALLRSAREAGIPDEALTATGLCVPPGERSSEPFDRFSGRVIYPVFTVSGRPVAFGARTLRTSGDTAKYVNSPESEIYSKSNELYGLYQAREAIVERGYCILVEGYMDVISMHQLGLRNVVASSGTSLTAGQVALLRRFTDRVIVIYDSDPAGIKASVRSIDMLLGAGIDMTVVTLPPGDDPDSYARSHTLAEAEAYLAANQRDFIDFRLGLLPERVLNDPIELTKAVSEIIMSIARISPSDKNRRRHYIELCRNNPKLRISENTLTRQIAQRTLEIHSRSRQAAAAPGPEGYDPSMPDSDDLSEEERPTPRSRYLRQYEYSVVRLAIRYGLMTFPDSSAYDGEGFSTISVLHFIFHELDDDEIVLSNSDYRHALDYIRRLADSTDTDSFYDTMAEQARSAREEYTARQRASRHNPDDDLATLELTDRQIDEEADAVERRQFDRLCSGFISRTMLYSDDDGLRRLAATCMHDFRRMSAIYTRNGSTVETEEDRLSDLVLNHIYVLKYAIVLWSIKDITAQMRTTTDPDRIEQLLTESLRLTNIKKALAQVIGDRVIAPPL